MGVKTAVAAGALGVAAGLVARSLVRQRRDSEGDGLATHVLPLDEGPAAYEMFKEKTDGCVRAVFQP